jgi:hypothetical protein
MTHEICPQCETVGYCMKFGCIPLQPQAQKPCRSPYCECTPGQCSHPGCYDARSEPFEHPADKRRISNSDFRELLDYYPRLRAWYNIGPVQRCELEAFVNAALQADMVAVTADGELVQAGDTVYVLSSTGKIESATVQKPEVLTDYYLYHNIPVSHSFSSEQAAQNYKDQK